MSFFFPTSICHIKATVYAITAKSENKRFVILRPITLYSYLGLVILVTGNVRSIKCKSNANIP